jgi:hypothetical protein
MTIAVMPKHTFNYDGVEVNIYHANKEVIINKYSKPVNLKQNEWHEIEALENNTVFVNIFAEGKN